MANRLTDERITEIASQYWKAKGIKSKALQAVGYSKNYSERAGLKLFDNVQVKAAIEAKRQEIDNEEGYDLKHWLADLQSLASRSRERGRLEIEARCLDMLAKYVGSYEVDNRQKQDNERRLTKKQWQADGREQAEVKDRYANIKLADVVATG